MDDLLARPVYSLAQAEKRRWLTPALAELTSWHRERCPEYRRIVDSLPPLPGAGLEALLPLHVRLFKSLRLASVPPDQVFRTLYSSGTSGSPSTILLDRETATAQSKVLVRVMQEWLGKSRLPMLIVDHAGTAADRTAFSARATGIKGLSFLGRDHCYALDAEMALDWPALEAFMERHGEGPVFIFGFTFMVWRYLLEPLRAQGRRLRLPQAVLVHSGGWKKLEERAVTNEVFKEACAEALGLERVHNFYGLVEQVGAVFVECERGRLHAPVFADVVVRDGRTLEPAPPGREGALQVCSVLPRSYPGHLILTEDRATLLGEDDCPCGRLGRTFAVQGRLPTAEVRGCSDTHREAAR